MMMGQQESKANEKGQACSINADEQKLPRWQRLVYRWNICVSRMHPQLDS